MNKEYRELMMKNSLKQFLDVHFTPIEPSEEIRFQVIDTVNELYELIMLLQEKYK